MLGTLPVNHASSLCWFCVGQMAEVSLLSCTQAQAYQQREISSFLGTEGSPPHQHMLIAPPTNNTCQGGEAPFSLHSSFVAELRGAFLALFSALALSSWDFSSVFLFIFWAFHQVSSTSDGPRVPVLKSSFSIAQTQWAFSLHNQFGEVIRT